MKVCLLGPGTIVAALESRQNVHGQTRIRCRRGWISQQARNGALLLEPVSIGEARTAATTAAELGVTAAAEAEAAAATAKTAADDAALRAVNAQITSALRSARAAGGGELAPVATDALRVLYNLVQLPPPSHLSCDPCSLTAHLSPATLPSSTFKCRLRNSPLQRAVPRLPWMRGLSKR